MDSAPYVLHVGGRQIIPFVFSSPHSGRLYTESFLAMSRLDRLTLRRSEDAFIDELFAPVLDLGAPLLAATFPRAFLDVNREAYELDPRMFDGRLPGYANTRSMRVMGGLGTIPRIVGEGQDIYRDRLPVAEALFRVSAIHAPYHRCLKDLIHVTRATFGFAILIDCHSMPSASLGPQASSAADIVLGDRYGTSCNTRTIDVMQEALERVGFRVVRNRPYAGGYITEHYGHPRSGVHALQIEINRALYLDEARMEKSDAFGTVKEQLMVAISEATARLSFGDNPYALAAE